MSGGFNNGHTQGERGPIPINFVLFVNFYTIRYGDTVEQTTCTFSRLIRTNDLGKSLPAQCMGRRWLYYQRESSGKTRT